MPLLLFLSPASLGCDTFAILSKMLTTPLGIQESRLCQPPIVADALAHGDSDRYLLVGMWVHPTAKRKGVGRVLNQAVRDL